MLGAGVPAPSRVRVTGGGSRSRLWLEILSEVMGVRVATTSTSEGAAQGAAMLAAVGVGWFDSVEAACRELVGVTDVAGPSDDRDVYAAAHDRYRALYPALAPTFRSMGTS
jgi:xylulokinase